MARVAGSANPDKAGGEFIPMLLKPEAGVFTSLDAQRIYMPTSNSVWTYDDTTKLMTVRYSAPGGLQYDDPISKTLKANNSTESYRVIPVMTPTAPNGTNLSRAHGVVLFRSDDSSSRTPGFLHNKYVSILYHGSTGTTALTGTYFVFMTNANTLREATNLTATASTSALYTVLTPYETLDLSPFNKFIAARNPDTAESPSTWAIATSSGTTNNYQHDPSNTTLVKMTQKDLDDRVVWVETITTPVNASTGIYGATTRQTAKYRLDLIHTVTNEIANPYIANNSRQIGFKLIAGTYSTSAADAPSGIAGTDPGTTPNEMFMAIRTAKLITPTAPENDASWEAIADESLYIGTATVATDGVKPIYDAFVSGANPREPYGVAAYTSAIDRATINYYFSILANRSINFMTTAQNTIAQNTYNTGAIGAGNSPQLFFKFNVGRDGGHGWGGGDIGVLSMGVGFNSSSIVAAANPSTLIDGSRMAHYWIRPIRRVDANTFIFQLYGGQNAPGSGSFATGPGFTEGGITYTFAKLNSIVANKYWIVRAGEGSELWRARITNGSTPSEALQNLGALSSPNLAPAAGINRRVLQNLANGIEYVGNADVDPTIVRSATPNTLTPAQQDIVFGNRVPTQLELDNYTNWVFSTDTANPSVTVTIRANSGGAVVQSQATYGIAPVYSDTVTSPFRGIFALSGFGPFGGRLIAVRLGFTTSGGTDSFNPDEVRLIAAPTGLTRALNADGTTNTNWAFLVNTTAANSTDVNHTRFTYQASKAGSTITWGNATFYNFPRKSKLNTDAGILSRLNTAGNRIMSKSGDFVVANPALQPKRVYDPDTAYIYSADFGVVPPTITVQAPGESPMTYTLGGASGVETIASQAIQTDAGVNVNMNAVLGSVRLGDTDIYLGIKILTTNSVVNEGNAGIILTTVTNPGGANPLQTVSNTVRSIVTIPNHDYAKNVVTTSVVLDDLEAAGPIVSLNYYRGFDALNNTEWTFNKAASTVLVTRLSGGGIEKSSVYQTVIVKDFAQMSITPGINDTSDLYGVILLKPTSPSDAFG
ncbi:MAG: hypothetical protein ACRCY4_04305, partial [Brevinema sp.]